MQQRVNGVEIIKIKENKRESRDDLLAFEEPLEIRIGFGTLEHRYEIKLAVTMRTPGNDHELVQGFLFSEGIISSFSDIIRIVHCEDVKVEEKGNVVRVELKPDIDFDSSKFQRNFYTTSSCGVCGKTSIDAVHQTCNSIEDNLVISPECIHDAPKKLRNEQLIFEYTGGLHACGLFNSNGTLVLMCEDIGRHNAMDKLIGAALEKELDLSAHYVLVSGRASFELVQKAAVASIPLLAAVGAPSHLAVELAKSTNMTLIGFVRNGSFNIYSGEHRIKKN